MIKNYKILVLSIVVILCIGSLFVFVPDILSRKADSIKASKSKSSNKNKSDIKTLTISKSESKSETKTESETKSAALSKSEPKSGSGSESDDISNEPYQPKANLSKMTAFWRNRPVIGEWHAGGQGLVNIPDYMLSDDIRFKYIKRPYETEVPFVDDINMVRILGGWSKTGNSHYGVKGDLVENYDLAYRNAEGKIEYRWDLLKARIDPYIQAGYTKLR